jgi:nitrate reductase gamma subunit
MSPFLHTLENEVQLAALAFMAVVYAVRLAWLFRFKSSRERTYAAGSERAGIAYSLLNVGMPWTMESTRKRPFFYAQFVVFHIGVLLAIAATFIIPYAPRLFEIPAVVKLFQAVLGLACLTGLIRLLRRLTTPALRLVSTADDYASLILMILFFGAGVLAVPNTPERGEGPLVTLFALTAFFLVYVPFSKICHYLYYPFTRYFLGRTQGHRGVHPLKKFSAGPRPPEGRGGA